MKPWIIVGLGAFLVAFVLGVLITALPKRRAAAEQVGCQQNLKDLASFAAWHASPEAPAGRPRPMAIPAGTIVRPGTPPEARLSWVPAAIPTLDQRRQPAVEILETIDAERLWEFPKNREAAKRKLASLLCPGNPPSFTTDEPAPTQYLGFAGVGADAATLTFVPPAPPPPRAGCFRYDAPTPFDSIRDGLSQSLLFGERSTDLGPWLRGGPATVRGITDDATPFIGRDAQFGGNHPDSSNWAVADGSIRIFTPRVNRKVILAMATIAGDEAETTPE